ncbi:ParB/RepB/Spo0J family partition protein [bacterium]|nr:ParB/RepB/Spo0J family partition protein [bacterium]MCI0605696.1 ParB/RepB/Spo0J family partition protein [bacterium]
MATKRKALGKGLGALLPSVPAGAAEKTYMELPIDEIMPNKYQPRTNFNDESLNELAQSIKSDGVIQPVIVRRSGTGYELITGERRWRAAKKAGLRTIPAVVRDVSEFRTLEWALIENIQRQDLNPLEEATAYASLIDDFHLTQEELAQRVGKDRSSIANYLRLLKLPAEIKEKIERNELTMGHARALISLEKAKDQLELANRIISEQLNVRQVESLIRSGKGSRKKRKGGSGTAAQDPNVRAAQQKLQEYLGTKVLIGPSKIEIHYENPDDLIRIYEKLIG